ncbi:MAG: bifunctional UDP-N-acetylmuramoyl-tripeptide:D-alanyl-D-alanine ligase/alanine racemase [Parachlamydiaceae bacterium]|nr:bifunctional UDP-N-acetylmuramoyl-tripeptide:D-alanyl-D-alanine ligase/alanine racemase [Parachlamydiaceae bacterium]
MDAFDLRQWSPFKTAGGQVDQPAIIDQIVIDSRRIHSPNTLFVALKGVHVNGHQFVTQAAHLGAKFALVSHDFECNEEFLKLKLLRVPEPLRAFQEIAKAYRLQLPVKIIGITGSFGKTMVKDLLFTLLNTTYKTAASPESFNSQIGVPLSLLTLRKEHEVAIIEAAISHKNEMDFLVDLIRPDFSIMAPIGKKHLATLADLSTTTQETMKLILNTPQTGWSLIPNEGLIKNHCQSIKSPYYFWDKKDSNLPYISTQTNDWVIPTPYQISFPNNDHFKGTINSGYSYFLNLLNMAVKAAWLMGIPSEKIKEVLSNYQPESMRTEIWKAPMGATFINDTYCSDPQSIDHALRHFNSAMPNQRKIFIFGGLQGGLAHLETDYKRVAQILSKSGINDLILHGNKEYSSLINELKTSQKMPTITQCSNSEEALDYLKSCIHPQDLILIKGEKKVSLDELTETFNDSLSNNQCVINFAAIQSNIATLKQKTPPNTRLMMIVKALAYGTDDVRMAKFLNTCGIDILGVSYVDEGVVLKRAGVKHSIFSINAAVYEASKVAKWDLEIGVSDKEMIQAIAIEAKKLNKQIKVHLHINTGMGRFGCRPEDGLELAKYITSFPNLIFEGIMTHFACAEDPNEDEFTFSQVKAFDNVIEQLQHVGISPTWRHAANSSAAIRFSLPQYNMIRVGLAAYGLYSSNESKEAADLRLALSLTSRIVGINICKKGETISYGRSYKIEKDIQKIAVLPIGYFDGLHRNYSGKAFVLIRGKKAPMVGKICMDYMMVDITDIPNVKVGDKVLIFGEDEFGQYLSPEDLATSGNSIIHELITCLGPRIQRVFVYEEGHQVR